MKVLAVGDIHTKLWIIERVKKLVDNYDKIVFVGDYADDWDSKPMDTIRTWKALMAFQKKYLEKVDILIGNHDYIYVNYTKTISSGFNPTTKMLLDAPENIKVRDWLQFLPVTFEIDGVTYSHAGVTEDFNHEYDSVSLWKDDSPIWARPSDYSYVDLPQVFGHTPSETCWEVQPNIWCIDTFSTRQDGTPIGDQTVLEIIDGETFNKIGL